MSLATLALAGPTMIADRGDVVVGAAAPVGVLALRGGGELDLASLTGDGEVTVLTFWASWCAPCLEALPELAALQAERPDLVVLTVNVDRSRDHAELALAGVDLPLPIAWDTDATLLGELDVIELPSTFLVDDAGVVRQRVTGYTPTGWTAGLEASLAALPSAKPGKRR